MSEYNYRLFEENRLNNKGKTIKIKLENSQDGDCLVPSFFATPDNFRLHVTSIIAHRKLSSYGNQYKKDAFPVFSATDFLQKKTVNRSFDGII